jgi:hypothetical protein
MKEFNLSERITPEIVTEKGIKSKARWIHKSDVKEFIKELKDDFKKDKLFLGLLRNVESKIDELAGSELTEELK